MNAAPAQEAQTDDLLDRLDEVTRKLEKAVTRLEVTINKPEEDRGGRTAER